MVPRAGIEPARILKVRRILSPVRLPVSPPGHKMEVPTGLEPMITELQSVALPTWPWNHFLFMSLNYYMILSHKLQQFFSF